MFKAFYSFFSGERLFKEASKKFIIEFEALTVGERSPDYIFAQKSRIKRLLNPFFGENYLSRIDSGFIQEYRIFRMSSDSPPAKSTMKQEIVTLRQILKTAVRYGWLKVLPDMSVPYRSSLKIAHRGWFNENEYNQLLQAIQSRIDAPIRCHYLWNYQQLFDLVQFLASTGLRPDELSTLEYRDIQVINESVGQGSYLLISVRGKRGVGYCKSTSCAIPVYNNLVNRNFPKQQDKIFPRRHSQLFNIILKEQGLKFDREGNRRTIYSLRHTYICFRLLAGADIYQVAKNCRTSVEMIEKFYASHLQNNINVAALNC